ncbi:hypothetical protein [Clostridium brassicae]|uniref:DUF2577 domain-containing protein n=1 Tax=Clostridium brassicae TaxID=2999072 RepID=A0ABT4D6P1_9CLOT|nr:hypothetical protein [Clostridium brassicae]MCY6957965.1 hypothetical protein [Clostridium brassicae]
MNYAIEFSKLLKQRDNKEYIGIVVGKIVSINPIKISILSGEVLLTKGIDLTLTTTAKNKILDSRDIGKRILVMASTNNQQYFAIDTVE